MLTGVQILLRIIVFLFVSCMHAFKSSYEHSSKYDTCVSYYHARNARIKREYLLLKLTVSHARWLNWCKLIGLIPLVQSNRPAHWQARDFYRNMYTCAISVLRTFAYVRVDSQRRSWKTVHLRKPIAGCLDVYVLNNSQHVNEFLPDFN